MISINEDKTEFEPNGTIYHVTINYNKESYEIAVRRMGSDFACIEADDVHPVLQAMARKFVKDEFAKMFVLGDY